MPVVRPISREGGSYSSSERLAFTQFRPIIPRSMSGSLSQDSNEIRMRQLSVINSLNRQKPQLHTYFSVPYHPRTRYGYSFIQFPNTRVNDTRTKTQKPIAMPPFPIQHLQTIFAVAIKLLTKETLEHLDEQASNIFAFHQIKGYCYKSFSETLNLVLVTLLREILQHQIYLPAPFTKDVQEFVKRLFLNGQTELQNKQQDQEREKREENGIPVVNKYKVNVMANAACVDLLVWAIRDDTVDEEYNVPSLQYALSYLMQKVLNKCEIILYADDTLIFTEGFTDEECYENMVYDINNVNEWLKMNKLKLNENKTKIMQINMNSCPIFKINDQVMERVNRIKYLGFIIDEKLKFNDHIEHICKKIGKKNWIL